MGSLTFDLQRVTPETCPLGHLIRVVRKHDLTCFDLRNPPFANLPGNIQLANLLSLSLSLELKKLLPSNLLISRLLGKYFFNSSDSSGKIRLQNIACHNFFLFPGAFSLNLYGVIYPKTTATLKDFFWENWISIKLGMPFICCSAI